MRLLFVHQNFPAQYRHLAALAGSRSDWDVVALAMRVNAPIAGVRTVLHHPENVTHPDSAALASDFENKVIRGKSAAAAALKLRNSGFSPDVICGHPGWGETLFLKDVWPNASLISYFEFYYYASGADFGFDPEFPYGDFNSITKLRIKNAATLLALNASDHVISPTKWQAKQLPTEYSGRLSIIHDGIDTRVLTPSPSAFIDLKRDDVQIKSGDEVVTFVSRNLEPYRGYHSFMRAVPMILKQRKNARVIIVGGNGVSYGRPSISGESYRSVFLNEVKDHLDMSRVHFVGNLTYSNYVRLLQVSACHVYLTYPFVLSWSMLEALAVGCLVVGSDTPPVIEFLKDGYNGLLVDFFRPEDISSRVIDVLSNPNTFSKIRENARNSVMAYDLTTVCLPAQLKLVTAHLAS